MTTYKHPNGVTVEIDDEGYLGIPPRPGRLDPNEVTAIRACFLDSLGLWLDEQTGYLVDTMPDKDGYHGIIATRDAEGWRNTMSRRPGEGTDPVSQVLDRYLATVTPPPTPQPGERWLLTLDIGGRTAEATVVEHDGETLFVFCYRTTGQYVARPVAQVFEGNRMRVES